MSEQGLKASLSGASSATGTAATGTYTVLAGGKAESASGKDLPTVVVSKPDLEKFAQELNKASQSLGRDLRFQVDLERGNAILQVVDSETGEIIRQIPQEEAVRALDGFGKAQVRLFDALV